MDPKDILLDLGFEDKEVTVYLALLELGEASVLEISKKALIKRPTAYVVLNSLEEKGFVSHFKRGKRTLYAPQHPQKLLTEAELRLKELQEVMPQLESLVQKEGGKPRVVIYEGKDKLDMAYDDVFLIKGETMYIGTIALSMEVFPRTFRKVDYATLSPEFTLKELVDKSEEGVKYAKQVRGPYREVRLLPKEMMPFDVDIGIFGNRVLITSVKKEYFTVSIESEEVSNAFRKMYNVIWGLSVE